MQTTRADPGHSHASRWLIAIAVMSSAVMEVLDTSVVNVSLPHIAGNISAPAHMGVSPHLSIPDFPGLRSRSGSLGS